MEVRTILADMPASIKGFTILSQDDYYTIVLNKNLSHQQNIDSYWHEIRHIANGDFDKNGSADNIEFHNHNKGEKNEH